MEIDKNNPNHIFVFGSNTEGRHGKGAALYAKLNHGAIYGQPEGLQGNAYAIITKNLNPKLGKYGRRSISLFKIGYQLETLYEFALQNPHLTFFISKIGTGNAGYTNKEIKAVMMGAPWIKHPWPSNCILPDWN